MGRAPQSRSGPSPAVDTLLTIGLFWAGVGTVSMLFLEKMDDAILLSVMLCSWLRLGVPDLLLGVTGRGNLDPEPRDRSVYPDRLVVLDVLFARPGDTCWAALTVELLLNRDSDSDERDGGVGIWKLTDEFRGDDDLYKGRSGGRCGMADGGERVLDWPRPTPFGVGEREVRCCLTPKPLWRCGCC